jgi:divalent metal cation (Fe/Co/Zn/Cd) transporter
LTVFGLWAEFLRRTTIGELLDSNDHKLGGLSLGILTITALAQGFIYTRTLSVALLADLIHNFGDALTRSRSALRSSSAASAASG